MVQINLLPPDAQKKKKIKIESKAVQLGPIIFALAGVMVAIIVLWAVLGMRLNVRNKKLVELDKELQSQKATLDRVDELRKEKEHLQRKTKFLQTELSQEMLWAELLNRLSDLKPEGIWLKKLSLRTRKEGELTKYDRLDITGFAISSYGEEMIDVIGRFMSALKDDEVLAGQFAELKLISSKRNKKGKIETMDFALLYKFK